MFYSENRDSITLKIKAQPKSSRNEFCGLYGDDAIKVKVKAPPVDGAANKEIVKFLSKEFKISKSDIKFISGESSNLRLLSYQRVKNY